MRYADGGGLTARERAAREDDPSNPPPRAVQRPSTSARCGRRVRWHDRDGRDAAARARNANLPLLSQRCDKTRWPTESPSVIVVACPEWAERILQAGNMGCPRCPGRLRPFGHGRTRTVRGGGGGRGRGRGGGGGGGGGDMLRVTPRRARCGDCGGTQILLPTTLTVRQADSTEVIGAALAAKAGCAGFRDIAATLARPVPTVRSWLRRHP